MLAPEAFCCENQRGYIVGFLYIFLVVLSITAVALIAKMASQHGVDAFGLSASLFIVAAIFGAVVLWWHLPAKLAPGIWVVSAVAGIGGAFAVLGFNVAVRQGHFGFSSAIYRSSFIIPVVYSVLFLNASLKPTTVLGISLILSGIFLMSWSVNAFKKGSRVEFRWFVLIILSFALSGAPRVGQTLTNVYGMDLYLYLFFSYAFGAAVFIFELLRKKPLLSIGKAVGTAALAWGTGAALASYVGVFCTLKSLETLKPQIVFPISLSGPIILGVILSIVLFRERVRFSGWIGVVLGIGGITVLSIWK
jgi:drug/metabolite transporter (DMT)-like permease